MHPHEAPQHIKDELLDNETITWIGKPNPLATLCVALPVLLFAAFISSGFIRDLLDSFTRHMPVAFSLFNCIGLLFVILFASAPMGLIFRAMSTYYVVTDKRILVIRGKNNRKVEQYEKKSLTPMISITFMGQVSLYWTAPGFHQDDHGNKRPNIIWFNGIDPKEVHKITSEPFPKLTEIAKTMPPPR